jgi:hypothetical protein
VKNEENAPSPRARGSAAVGEGWGERKPDSERDQEGFFDRWSRVKSETREAREAPVQSTPAAPVSEAPPVLPPTETLTFDSDFTAFFHPKVEEGVRRAALRRLFSDPHFNVMDGLDVYIDDYSRSEPIPAAMLAALNQAQRILDWSRDTEAEPEEQGAQKTTAPGCEPNPDAPAPRDGAAVAAQDSSNAVPHAGECGEREG